MRRVTTIVSLFVTAAIIGSFTGGALVHALVPHSHDGGIIEAGMHAALRHEDKKAVTVPFTPFVIALTTLLVLFVYLELVPRTHTEALRRGIVKYRKFR